MALVVPVLTAQPRVLSPANGAKIVGPYSPGLAAGPYIYVSGQGALDSAGRTPEGVAAQTRQCLEHIKAILGAAGATMDNIVSTQIYVQNLTALPGVYEVYNRYFPKNPPAHVSIVISRLPTETPVEITVVAVKDHNQKKIVKGGVRVGDRLYLSAVFGRDMHETEKKLTAALDAAGYRPSEVVFANLYQAGDSTGPPDERVIPVRGLPGGAKAAISVIASKSAAIKRASGCATEGDTLYCMARAASVKGGIADQVRNVGDQMKASVTSQGFTLDQVVATNVYLNDLDEFGQMNTAYASFFPAVFPSRTTIQARPKTGGTPQFRLSLVAVR
jgi:2-iminobutanoate/2-iminopropanoate deaminase